MMVKTSDDVVHLVYRRESAYQYGMTECMCKYTSNPDQHSLIARKILRDVLRVSRSRAFITCLVCLGAS